MERGSNWRRVAAGLGGVLCTVSLAIAPAVASAAEIGFDDQSSGTVLDDQYAALGVHFGPSPFAGQSGKFTAVARPSQARSGPNVAAFAYDPAQDFSSSWIRFDKPQAKVSFYVCRTGGAGDPSQPNVNVNAYDANGTQIDNQQGIQCNLNGALVPVTVERQAITYINVTGTGGSAPPGPGWALDDLQFQAAPHTLTVTKSGAGAGTITGPGIDCGGAAHTDCSETVADGTAVKLTATPASGSAFSGFSGGRCAATSPCTVTMDADKTVDGRFDSLAGRRTLTVTKSGAGAGTVTGPGIDCGGAGHTDCFETVTTGATIALTANPASDSTFGGFSGGGCAATSPCTVTLDADKTVDARFAPRPVDPPGVLGLACRQVRQVRSYVAAVFDQLLARLPASAGQLRAVRDAYLRIFDALLARFGCAPAAKAASAARQKVSGLQVGTARGDHLRGAAGDDVQIGLGGNDRLLGGRGGDVMLGGPGNDRLGGGPGADIILGGPGKDVLTGGAGRDLIIAEAGNDTINARDGTRDYVICGRGRDRVVADKRDFVAPDCEHVNRH